MSATEQVTPHDVELRRRFREHHGYRPTTLSADEAEAKRRAAEERIGALIVELRGERSPLVDALAAARFALAAVAHDEGHPSLVVRASDALDDLDAAVQEASRLAAELRAQRGWWRQGSMDERCWREIEATQPS